MAPAWYMLGCVVVSLVAISLFEETGGKALDQAGAIAPHRARAPQKLCLTPAMTPTCPMPGAGVVPPPPWLTV